MTLPLWIRTADDLAALAAELAGTSALAIDTEADSLHHYPGKLCLVQLADAEGRGHLVDPLVLRDLSPFGPVLADPGTIKVLHAADNDLAYLKRLYGVTVTSLFDTAVAARFIGATSLGLEGLLTQYLGVTAVKSRQKDDWSRRPLTGPQEAYALDDVLHLIPLRARLLEELRAIGREQWVEEECAALAALAVPEKAADPDAYMKLKGARELDARGLAVLRELHAARETLALRLDRPPFMIVGNESLVALAKRLPAHAAAPSARGGAPTSRGPAGLANPGLQGDRPRARGPLSPAAHRPPRRRPADRPGRAPPGRGRARLARGSARSRGPGSPRRGLTPPGSGSRPWGPATCRGWPM